MDTITLETPNINIDEIKNLVANQPITDISVQMNSDVITPTHFESAELAELQAQIRQIYLIDLSECEQITEQWIRGLNNFILGANLTEINSNLAEVNDERFSHGQLELLPDTALTINIRVQTENKTLFIGYLDSNQAYRLLSGYVRYLVKAKLYKIENDTLHEVKETDIGGLRIHV